MACSASWRIEQFANEKDYFSMNNTFAIGTFNYIWSHPSSRQRQIRSITTFIGWQFYKRITKQAIDIQLVPNIKLRCYPDSRSASSVLYCGLYDYHDMNFLLRYLRSEDAFLDVGANVGVYTLLAASIIRSGAVYSFEALPKNYERLVENLQLNNLQQVKPFAIAISDSQGSIALDLAEGDSMPFITSQSSDRTITVPTNTLDQLLHDHPKESCTLGKMDIEGAEILALKGATRLLEQQRPPVWVLEINDAVKNFGHEKQDVVDLLKGYGYSLYAYNVDTNQLCPISLAEQDGNNVLAIADSAIEFVRDRLEMPC
jgi:FkbM family methyltransferase